MERFKEAVWEVKHMLVALPVGFFIGSALAGRISPLALAAIIGMCSLFIGLGYWMTAKPSPHINRYGE